MNTERKRSTEQTHHLGDKISQLRDVIKRKYRNFKQGNLDTELLLEKSYKPLISELRRNVGKKETALRVKKEEPSEDGVEEELNSRKNTDDPSFFEPEIFSSPHPDILTQRGKSARLQHQRTPNEEIFETIANEDAEQHAMTSVLASEEGMESASQYIASNFINPITKRYMQKLMKDLGGKKQKIDHTFGPRYEGTTLMIGNKPLKFDDDGSIRVDDVIYNPTEGLYELVFKRIPDDEIFDDQDLAAYKDILQRTNAHKRGYKYRNNVNRGNSVKYRTVIAKLFPKTLYGGTGRTPSKGKDLVVMKSLKKNPDIVYWDNANELCDRLRLLVVSAETGNNSHTNEIINIIEELKEAKVISGKGNSKFLSLLQ